MNLKDSWLINTLPILMTLKDRKVSIKYLFRLYKLYDRYKGEKLTYRDYAKITNIGYLLVAHTSKFLIKKGFLEKGKFEIKSQKQEIKLFNDNKTVLNNRASEWLIRVLNHYFINTDKDSSKATLRVLYKFALSADTNLNTPFKSAKDIQKSTGVGLATIRNISSLLRKDGFLNKNGLYEEYYLINKRKDYNE